MNKGVLYAVAAYFLWGFFPLYFKALHQLTALEILAHRVVWSLVLLVVVVSIQRSWKALRATLNGKVLLIYGIAAVLLAANWYLYIWAVNSDFILEASLGYFINPLVNVLLGTVFLRERLKSFQWVPIGIAAVGVLFLTITYGRLPWIALSLAFTFGLYGLMKKLAPLNSLHGLSLETMILFVPAFVYLVTMETSATGSYGHLGLGMNLLVMLSGVITALPLLLFASAAHLIPLTTLGLIQYIAPTLQFLIGVAVFHEPFTPSRMIGFSIIWFALILYSGSNLFERWKSQRALA